MSIYSSEGNTAKSARALGIRRRISSESGVDNTMVSMLDTSEMGPPPLTLLRANHRRGIFSPHCWLFRTLLASIHTVPLLRGVFVDSGEAVASRGLTT